MKNSIEDTWKRSGGLKAGLSDEQIGILFGDAIDGLRRIAEGITPEQRTDLAPWINKTRDAITNLKYAALTYKRMT